MENRIKHFNSEKVYLDYLNNYLTVECLAKDYCITISQAEILINAGRQVNHKRAS